MWGLLFFLLHIPSPSLLLSFLSSRFLPSPPFPPPSPFLPFPPLSSLSFPLKKWDHEYVITSLLENAVFSWKQLKKRGGLPWGAYPPTYPHPRLRAMSVWEAPIRVPLPSSTKVKDNPAIVFSGETKDWTTRSNCSLIRFEGGRALAEFFVRQLKEKTDTRVMRAKVVAHARLPKTTVTTLQ
jgi:hypothetical protein